MSKINAHPRYGQTGGITILVALMMLVLLTIAAVGMSRNSFREVVSSGFARQGALARNAADSGVEWCLYWLDQQNSPAAAGSSLALVNEQETLLQNKLLAGQSFNIIGGSAYATGGTLKPDMEVPGPTGTTVGYTIGMTNMGKLPIAGMSQGSGAGAFAPAAGGAVNMAPDLWSIRSDAQVQQGGVTFVHSKEAWISNPSKQ